MSFKCNHEHIHFIGNFLCGGDVLFIPGAAVLVRCWHDLLVQYNCSAIVAVAYFLYLFSFGEM